MKKLVSIVLVFVSLVTFYSCSKEYSLEGGPAGPGSVDPNAGTSAGTLGGTPGACASAVVNGVFGQGIPATDSNYLTVQVTITTRGTYTVATDTANGIYFAGSGTFTDTGIQNVRIRAFGTPLNAGQFSHTVKYKGSICTFTVDAYQVANATSSDYFPTTTNSNWSYATIDPAASDTNLVISKGTLVTIASNSYNLFTSNDGSSLDSQYYRKGSGLYYQFGDLDLTGATTGVVGENIILKDNVAAGSSWESPEFNTTLQGVPVKAKLVNTVLVKNENKLVDNKVFANVISVVTSFRVQAPIIGFTEFFSYETWYAKGIGIIYVNIVLPGFGQGGYKVQRYQVF